MRSHTTKRFRRAFNNLPPEIQRRAERAYEHIVFDTQRNTQNNTPVINSFADKETREVCLREEQLFCIKTQVMTYKDTCINM